MAKNRKKVMGTGTSDPTPLLEEVGTPTSGNPPVSNDTQRVMTPREQFNCVVWWGGIPQFLSSTGGGGLARDRGLMLVGLFQGAIASIVQRTVSQHSAVVPSSRPYNRAAILCALSCLAGVRGQVVMWWYGGDSPHLGH